MGAQLLERARESAEAAGLPEEFRWVLWLSPGNLAAFKDAITRASKADLTDTEVTELLEDWRATAELDAAPEVVVELHRPKRYLPLSKFITS